MWLKVSIFSIFKLTPFSLLYPWLKLGWILIMAASTFFVRRIWFFLFSKQKKVYPPLSSYAKIGGKVVSQLGLTVPDDYLVHFINFGIAFGESILITTQTGKAILVDAGDSLNLLKTNSNKIVNYLQSFGVNNLEAIILSHPHDDHLSMIGNVINAMPVREFICSSCHQMLDKYSMKLYCNLKKLISRKGILIREVSAGQQLVYDNLTFTFFSPPPSLFTEDTLPGITAANNNSLVFKLVNNSGISILFTGDIESEALNYLLKDTFPFKISATILKVPHHGNFNSYNQKFYYSVSPAVSIISCPGFPCYPSRNVLVALDNISSIYRTDLHGNIVIKVKNNSYAVLIEK